MVYRYSLRCFRPIRPSGSTVTFPRLKLDKRDNVSINLLRTCRQINIEGSQVFYGDNTFELLRESALPNITTLLSPASIDWLKELIIAIPFVHGKLSVHKLALNYVNPIPPEKRVLSAGKCRTDFLLNGLIQVHLDTICSASNLRKLTMVIEPNWHLYITGRVERKQSEPDAADQIRAYLNLPDVWEDLATLIKHKPDLEIVVVRLYEQGKPVPRERSHARLLSKLKLRLGIWDVREAPLFVNQKKKRGFWTMPPANPADNPEDLLESVQAMFSEKN